MALRSFLESFPVRVTEGEVFLKFPFSTPRIGIFAGCDISLIEARGISLADAKFLPRRDFFKQTFQYTRGTARNRNIGTWGRVKQPHPASRNLRFSDLASAGHAGNYIVLCRPLWEKRPGA